MSARKKLKIEPRGLFLVGDYGTRGIVTHQEEGRDESELPVSDANLGRPLDWDEVLEVSVSLHVW